METLTMKHNFQNTMTLQNLNVLRAVDVSRLKDKEDEFDRDLKRAISGDELMNRLSTKIHKMFKNGSSLSSGS